MKAVEGLDYETILEILDYWFEDIQNNFQKIPPKLKGKVTKEDIISLTLLVKKEGLEMPIQPHDYDKLRSEILQRIKIKAELESLKKTEAVISKQIELQEETKNIQKRQTKIITKQTNFIFLSVIVASVSLLIATCQMMNESELIDKQLKSISPLKPTLEVSLDFPEDRSIDVRTIAQISTSPDGNQDYSKAKIRFIISNIGRMKSGAINANLESDIINQNAHLDNIIGESSEYVYFFVSNKYCSKYLDNIVLENGSIVSVYTVDKKCDYTNSNIPLGWHSFNLTIECPFCKPTKISQLFEFCIYEDPSTCNVR